MPRSTSVADTADELARRAAGRSGVEIRLIDDLPGLEAVSGLFDAIWRPGPAYVVLTTEQLRALSYAGNYVAGAYDGRSLVGAAAGFFGTPLGVSMHSHVTGVSPSAAGRGIGWALKLHQRAWALRLGLTEITWTFDPLVRRNAYFNLVKLGARPRRYLVDFYGEIFDAVNAGQGSDRVLLGWELESPDVVATCAGTSDKRGVPEFGEASVCRAVSESASEHPQVEPESRWRAADVVCVQVPPDVVELRRRNPGAADKWRSAVRTVLGGLLADGARVTGFSRSDGYVVQRVAA